MSSPNPPKEGKYVYVSQYTVKVQQATGLDLSEQAIIDCAKLESVAVSKVNNRIVVDREDFEKKFEVIVSKLKTAYDQGLDRRKIAQLRHHVVLRSVAAWAAGGRTSTEPLSFASLLTQVNESLQAVNQLYTTFANEDQLEAYLRELEANQTERARKLANPTQSRFYSIP